MTHKGLSLWNKLELSDKSFCKKFDRGNFKGVAVDPAYNIKRLTEQLGPVGFAWGWHIVAERYDTFGEGKDAQTVHSCVVRAWFRQDDGSVREVEHIGATKIAFWSRGQSARFVVDDEGSKKSVTDALSKIMMSLGASADIWLGRFDGNKYVPPQEDGPVRDMEPIAGAVPPAAPEPSVQTEPELIVDARRALKEIPDMDAGKLAKLRAWLQRRPDGQNAPRWKLIASLSQELMDRISETTKKRLAELEGESASEAAPEPPPSRQNGETPRRHGTPEEETNAALAASEQSHALVRDAEVVLGDLEAASARDAVIGAWRWLNTPDKETGTTPFDRLGKLDRGDLRKRLQYLCHKKAEAMGVNLRAVPAA